MLAGKIALAGERGLAPFLGMDSVQGSEYSPSSPLSSLFAARWCGYLRATALPGSPNGDRDASLRIQSGTGICAPRVAIPDQTPSPGLAAAGIDLGLKNTAVTSDGERLPAGQFQRHLEAKLAQAQRRHERRDPAYPLLVILHIANGPINAYNTKG